MPAVRVALGATAALAMWLAPATANARPYHHGFTGDLGLGLAATTYPEYWTTSCGGTSPGCVSDTTSTTKLYAGIAPLSLSLGGFVVPRVAILARATGTAFWRGSGEPPKASAFYGAVAELWLSDVLFVSGGAGYARYGQLLGVTRGTGLALDLRAGMALAQGTNNDFTLSFEAIPAFYESRNITGLALVGAWKWY